MHGRGYVGHAFTRTPIGYLLSFLVGWEQVRMEGLPPNSCKLVFMPNSIAIPPPLRVPELNILLYRSSFSHIGSAFCVTVMSIADWVES